MNKKIQIILLGILLISFIIFFFDTNPWQNLNSNILIERIEYYNRDYAAASTQAISNSGEAFFNDDYNIPLAIISANDLKNLKEFINNKKFTRRWFKPLGVNCLNNGCYDILVNYKGTTILIEDNDFVSNLLINYTPHAVWERIKSNK